MSWPGLDRAEPVSAEAGAPSLEGEASLLLRLGYAFRQPDLLHLALAHRSWCAEEGARDSNERLEFLGDAVLGLVVAEDVYARFPGLPEGRLAKIRAAVVNARVLAEIAEGLGVGAILLLGRGEEASGGRTKPSILADAVEAVIGAAYLDGGFQVARRLIKRLLGDRIAKAAEAPDAYDHKSQLQELTVQRGVGTPRYVVHGSGPDHDRRYVAEVFVGGEPSGRGEGTSKKDAEQEAASKAYAALREA